MNAEFPASEPAEGTSPVSNGADVSTGTPAVGETPTPVEASSVPDVSPVPAASESEPPALIEPVFSDAPAELPDPATLGTASAPEPVAPPAQDAEVREASDAVTLEPAAPSATEPVGATSNPTAVFTEVAPAAPVEPATLVAPVVFVDAPETPRKKNNRGFGILIALLATIVFAAVYAGAAFVILVISPPARGVGASFSIFLQATAFWVPAVFFFVFFALLVLLVNRGGWWAYVLLSHLIGAIVYAGSVAVFLLQHNIFALTADKAASQASSIAGSPYVIAAGIVAFETAIWAGAIVAARGRRVKARNLEALEAHERAEAAVRVERDASGIAVA